MSKVYIIQDIPGRNFEPAREHGEIEILLSKNEGYLRGQELFDKLETKLREFDDDDFLLTSGSPMAIGIATYLCLTYVDVLFMLAWDGKHYRYNVETIDTRNGDD